jgi:hypothetical protein
MCAWDMQVRPAATGLPELTGFFLEDEGLQPQTLYSYCKPRDREGLITAGGEMWSQLSAPQASDHGLDQLQGLP